MSGERAASGFTRLSIPQANGCVTTTVGEEMELVLRLHRWHRERRIPYRIRYLPDPICWTEAPEDLVTLGRQRSRWQRGLAESLTRHARLALSPRAGAAGLLAWPFMAVFEWIGPLVELAGYVVMLGGFALGVVSSAALIVFLLVAIGMGILLSVNGLLLETLSFRVYARKRDMLLMFAMAVLASAGEAARNSVYADQINDNFIELAGEGNDTIVGSFSIDLTLAKFVNIENASLVSRSHCRGDASQECDCRRQANSCHLQPLYSESSSMRPVLSPNESRGTPTLSSRERWRLASGVGFS